jgi:hypothetical protein
MSKRPREKKSDRVSKREPPTKKTKRGEVVVYESDSLLASLPIEVFLRMANKLASHKDQAVTNGILSFLDVIALDNTCKRLHLGLRLEYRLVWFRVFENAHHVFGRNAKAFNRVLLNKYAENRMSICFNCMKCMCVRVCTYVHIPPACVKGTHGDDNRFFFIDHAGRGLAYRDNAAYGYPRAKTDEACSECACSEGERKYACVKRHNRPAEKKQKDKDNAMHARWLQKRKIRDVQLRKKEAQKRKDAAAKRQIGLGKKKKLLK